MNVGNIRSVASVNIYNQKMAQARIFTSLSDAIPTAALRMRVVRSPFYFRLHSFL